MRRINRALLIASSAALLTGAFAGTVAADTSTQFGVVHLTLNGSEATLICGPDIGTHPDPRGACDSLRAVTGDVAALPSVPGMACYMIYAPVTATATGLWASADRVVVIDYSETFANDCIASVETDFVFGF